MSKVKVGVVGVGRMGTYHVGILAELTDVELAAVVDTDPKNLQKNREELWNSRIQ